MRRVCYSVAISLDGYIAGADGEIDWIVVDPEIDFAALFQPFDTVLLGRKSYEAARRQGQGAGMPGMQAYVFSRTLSQSECPDAIVSDDLAATLPRLKAATGKDTWLFGGGQLFRSLLQLGLVDAVQVGIVPVILGAGLPLVEHPAGQARLKLTKHKVYAQTGTVLLDYDVL